MNKKILKSSAAANILFIKGEYIIYFINDCTIKNGNTTYSKTTSTYYGKKIRPILPTDIIQITNNGTSVGPKDILTMNEFTQKGQISFSLSSNTTLKVINPENIIGIQYTGDYLQLVSATSVYDINGTVFFLVSPHLSKILYLKLCLTNAPANGGNFKVSLPSLKYYLHYVISMFNNVDDRYAFSSEPFHGNDGATFWYCPNVEYIALYGKNRGTNVHPPSGFSINPKKLTTSLPKLKTFMLSDASAITMASSTYTDFNNINSNSDKNFSIHDLYRAFPSLEVLYASGFYFNTSYADICRYGKFQKLVIYDARKSVFPESITAANLNGYIGGTVFDTSNFYKTYNSLD